MCESIKKNKKKQVKRRENKRNEMTCDGKKK
jgi:hypothetical protein